MNMQRIGMKRLTTILTIFIYGLGNSPFILWSQSYFSLSPISGADGLFEKVVVECDTLYRSLGAPGAYEYYMYFKTAAEVRHMNVYVEIMYKDIGYGYFGLEYNSTTKDYHDVSVRYQNYLQDTRTNRIAVFELKNAHFRNAQNLGADLRLNQPGDLQLHILSAKLYFEPPSSILPYLEDWISDYEGPEYIGPNLVDATMLTGKVICGYQGWFRAAGDPSGRGWVHYVAGNNFSDLTVEMWPDMSEYTAQEKYRVPNWTYANGDAVYLFSSANKKTVVRHFQWMEAYGIDGVAVQRFIGEIDANHGAESYRILGYAREAARRTGRTYFLMYDMSGNADINKMNQDWQYLVDVMKITEDDRYLHHEGKPVLGIFGFFADRFSATKGNQILDLFQSGGKYEAFVVGSGQWWWRSETAPGWQDVFQRMDAWIPWNVGHYGGDYAYTGYWEDDQKALEPGGTVYMPLVYPGFGWDNLMNLQPGTTTKSRLKGAFLWQQFLDAKALDAKTVYVAMFDEIDESTAIFKITNDIPVNHYFQDLQGLPSDFYLLLTGAGTSMINGTMEVPQALPDFAIQSQPPIPDIVFPQYGDTITSPVSISWTPVQHLSGIGEYELLVDDQLISTSNIQETLQFSEGEHTLQVRAVNGLGNRGGLSEAVFFTLSNSIVGVDSKRKLESAAFSLTQLYPNPFADEITIAYRTANRSYLSLRIFDINGNLINTLHDGIQNPGDYLIKWDGRDNRDMKMPTGIYFCRMGMGEQFRTVKLIRVSSP